jgi:DNA-binding NtrC family response regulator
MKPALQAKLLQVLQDGAFARLGSNRTVTTDARVLAATNQDLEGLIQRGDFREDLYYRLKVIEAVVPPLRERREEILPLADFFMAKYSERYKRPVRMLPPELWRLFQVYGWPGNVRELENTIKRFVILQDVQLVARELSTPGLQGQDGAPMSPASSSTTPPAMTVGAASRASPVSREEGRRLVDIARDASLAAERVAILDALRQVRWNRRKAAQMLGVSYKTLLNKIKETGIDPSFTVR